MKSEGYTPLLRQVTSVGGVTLPININDVLTQALVDTGSNSSMMSKHVLKAMGSHVKLKKSNKRELTVEYKVEKSWLGNVSFLIDHKYAVELGASTK